MNFQSNSLACLVVACLIAGACDKGPADSDSRTGLSVLAAPETGHLDPLVGQALQQAWQEFEYNSEGLQGAELAAAYGRLGMIYQANHFLLDARNCYRNAMQLAPDELRWRYYFAYLLEESGEVDEAIKVYMDVVERLPSYLPARLRLASLYIETGDNQAARRVLEHVLEREPGNASAIAGLARIALAEGKYQEAASNFSQALELQPDANRLYHPLGLALRGLGDTEGASAAFAQRGSAGTSYPDPWLAELGKFERSAQAYLSRAMLAANDGRYDLAAEAYAIAVKLDPTDFLARAGLAQALERLGRFDAAMAEVDRVLALAPDHALSRLQKGRLLERIGDDTKAIEQYRHALAAEPSYTEARFLLANSLMRRGRAAAAASEYEVAASELTDSVLVHYRLGLARMAAGQCAAATVALQRASDLNSSFGPVVQALVRNLATCPSSDAQQRRQAVQDGRWLYQQLPNVEHAEALAMALAAAGDMEAATKLQLEALDMASAGGAAAKFMGDNLARYRRGQSAERPWAEDAAVYLPPRFGG